MDLFRITDMLWEVMRRLTFRHMRAFSWVNKFIRRFYIKRSMGVEKMFGVPIFLGKRTLIQEMYHSDKRISTLMAPPSYGKTIVGLLLCLYDYDKIKPITSNNERYIITIPAKCLSMWISEINKLVPGAINPRKPEESLVVVDDRKRLPHFRYMRALEGAPTGGKGFSPSNRIILITHLVLMRKGNINWLHNGQQGWTPPFPYSKDMNVVVDEAHTSYISSDVMTSMTSRVHLLSATRISISHAIDRSTVAFFHIKRAEIENEIPKHIIHTTVKPLSTILTRSLTKHDKVVLFVYNRKDTRAEVAGILETMKQEVSVYEFASSMDKIRKFEEHKGKALLLAEYHRADVGLSIRAQAAILHDSEYISSKRFHQTISRLLRITNSADTVFFTAMFASGSLLLASVRVAIAMIKMTYDVTLTEAQFTHRKRLKMSSRLLASLELDPQTLNSLELLLLCRPNSRKLLQIEDAVKILGKERLKKVKRFYADQDE